jgi:DNA polymerase/3'-5' exonuclease PolX
MMIDFFGITVTVPEVMIEKYVEETKPMIQWENRRSLERLREAINDILFVVADNRQVLSNAEHYGNFVKSLAIRVALSSHRKLYDD